MTEPASSEFNGKAEERPVVCYVVAAITASGKRFVLSLRQSGVTDEQIDATLAHHANQGNMGVEFMNVVQPGSFNYVRIYTADDADHASAIAVQKGLKYESPRNVLAKRHVAAQAAANQDTESGQPELSPEEVLRRVASMFGGPSPEVDTPKDP